MPPTTVRGELMGVTMYEFAENELLEKSHCYRLWRRGAVVAIELFGPINDKDSEAWRSAVLRTCETTGWPRFFFVDLRKVDPQNSMLGRFRTANTGKIFLSKIEWMYALTGTSSGPLVVLRTVLRVIGATNLSLLSNEKEFERALNGALAGVRVAV